MSTGAGVIWAVMAPNAPNLIVPDVLGPGGRPTLTALEALNVELTLRPDVIIVASPHWNSNGPFLVDDSARPKFIEDFSGFPRSFYGHTYAPPGEPELARALVAAGRRAGLYVEANRDWGLDHGAWTALRPLAPSATIPVIPLSITGASPAEHLRWGDVVAAALKAAGRRAVVVGTGILIHNFARLSFDARAPPWAEGIGIESEVLDLIVKGDPAEVAAYDRRKWRAIEPEGDFAPYFFVAGATGAGFVPSLASNERVLGTAGLSVIEFRRRNGR
jgi:4,5-DOPA dioxygenase extradiol